VHASCPVLRYSQCSPLNDIHILNDIHNTVNQFRAHRKSTKEELQWKVLLRTAILVVVGAVCSIVGNVAVSFLPFCGLGVVVVSFGILLGTTVDLDWNTYLMTHPTVSRLLSSVFFSLGCLSSKKMPIFLLMTLPQAFSFFCNSKIPFDLLVLSLILFNVGVSACYFHCGLQAAPPLALLFCVEEFGSIEASTTHSWVLGTIGLFACAAAAITLLVLRAVGVTSTAAAILPCYILILLSGVCFTYTGLLRHDSNDIAAGIVLSALVVIVSLYRREIYGCISKWFEQAQKVKDGAFIVALLDDEHAGVKCGQAHWVKREDAGLQLDMMVPASDPRRFWMKGVLARLTARSGKNQPNTTATTGNGGSGSGSGSSGCGAGIVQFEVEVASLAAPIAISFATFRDASVESILSEANRNLRCVEWRDVNLELMSSSAGSQATYDLSRPLYKGERIDAFVSHSWHDCPSQKFARMSAWAEQFEREHGRFPTMWIDKVCLDQSCITDSLRMLPVNVMAADRVLIVHGATYTERLWCVLELFCVFAFAPGDCTAATRVDVAVANTGSSNDNALQVPADDLERFDLNRAHCFDPNEEAKLRRVIASTGTEAFVAGVRELGAQLRVRAKKLQHGRLQPSSKHSQRSLPGMLGMPPSLITQRP